MRLNDCKQELQALLVEEVTSIYQYWKVIFDTYKNVSKPHSFILIWEIPHVIPN